VSYVLVHLRGDENTRAAGHLVDHLEQTRAPIRRFQDEQPPHDEVTSTLSSTPVRTAVCVSHGSPRGLGSTRQHIWADAHRLGATFVEGRLYAYACSTAGDIESLGAKAVASGVSVFVGHDGVVHAPRPDHEQQMVSAVASAAILAFIDGEEDERRLSQIVVDAGDGYVDEDIVLDFTGGSTWLSQSTLFDRLAFSLRVHRRTEPTPSESAPLT